MSRDRRRQRRRRSGRGSTPGYEPVGKIEFPGIMGWMQRHMRGMFIGGILVMVLSLGAGTLFATNRGGTPSTTDQVSPTETPTPEATTEATASATPEDTIQRHYDAAPPLTIDQSKDYEAIIHLETGDVRLQLFDDDTPTYVNNFVFLAKNHFYDGLTFHRVIPNFVAQGGDPLGTGFGGPGYTLTPQHNNTPFSEGVISMATSSAGVNGSQFFITLRATPELQDGFTVFGKVIEGFDLIQGLTQRDPRLPGQPPGDVIKSIEIIEKGG